MWSGTNKITSSGKYEDSPNSHKTRLIEDNDKANRKDKNHEMDNAGKPNCTRSREIDEADDKRKDSSISTVRRAAATDAAKARLISKGWNKTRLCGLKGFLLAANIENEQADKQQVAEAQVHLDRVQKDLPQDLRKKTKASLIYDAFKAKEVSRRGSDSEAEVDEDIKLSGGRPCACRCGCQRWFLGLGFVCEDCKREGPRHIMRLGRKLSRSREQSKRRQRRSRSRSRRQSTSRSLSNVRQRYNSASPSPLRDSRRRLSMESPRCSSPQKRPCGRSHRRSRRRSRSRSRTRSQRHRNKKKCARGMVKVICE